MTRHGYHAGVIALHGLGWRRFGLRKVVATLGADGFIVDWQNVDIDWFPI
jgi:hypothetical protein